MYSKPAFTSGQPGISSIKITWRCDIFQPIAFNFLGAKQKWKFLRDPPHAALSLARACRSLAARFARHTWRVCQQAKQNTDKLTNNKMTDFTVTKDGSKHTALIQSLHSKCNRRLTGRRPIKLAVRWPVRSTDNRTCFDLYSDGYNRAQRQSSQG